MNYQFEKLDHYFEAYERLSRWLKIDLGGL